MSQTHLPGWSAVIRFSQSFAARGVVEAGHRSASCLNRHSKVDDISPTILGGKPQKWGDSALIIVQELDGRRTLSNCRQANSSSCSTGSRSITGREMLFTEDSIISAPYCNTAIERNSCDFNCVTSHDDRKYRRRTHLYDA